MDGKLEQFFAKYERAYSDADTETTVSMYTDCAVAAAPGFVGCTKDRKELRAAISQANQFYKGIGMQRAKVMSLDETPLGDAFSMVTVHWGVWFEKTGPEPVTFDVSYIVQKGDEPKIICFVSHASEHAMLTELGLMPGQ